MASLAPNEGSNRNLGRPLAPEAGDCVAARQHHVAQMLRAIAGRGPLPEGDHLRLGTGMQRGAGSCPRLTTGGPRGLGVGAPAPFAAEDGTLAAALRAGPSAFAPAPVEPRPRKAGKVGGAGISGNGRGSGGTVGGGASVGVGGYSAQTAAPTVSSEERTAQMRALLGQLNAPGVGGHDEPADAASRLLSQFSASRATFAPVPPLGHLSPKREKVGMGALGSLPEHRGMMGSDSCPDLPGKRLTSPQRRDLRSSGGRQQRRALGAGGCSMFRNAGELLAGAARPPTGKVL